jgi:hypothetical protein
LSPARTGIDLQRQLANLGMKGLHIDSRFACRPLALRAAPPRSAFQQLILPDRDLVGMPVKLPGQFSKGLFALEGGQGHFRLEGRGVIAAR